MKQEHQGLEAAPLDGDGNMTVDGSVQPGTDIPVSGLPAPSQAAGKLVYLTDSTAVQSEGQKYEGGWSNKAPAFSNGSVWKCSCTSIIPRR